MKSLRIFFMALYTPAPPPEQGLPDEEQTGFAQAWLLPASFLLRPDMLPEGALGRLLEDPSRARCSEFSVALWSAQQALCAQLQELGLDARGMPPISGRALEAFFLPSGRFWMGACLPADSLPQSQERFSKALGSLMKQAPLGTQASPFPWIPDFARGGGWALGANQALGARAEALGSSIPKRPPKTAPKNERLSE